MRLITEFDSPAISEYLVGQRLVRVDKARLNESAIIIKSSLIAEWKGKDESHKLSLILKLPVIRKILLMYVIISQIRYSLVVILELNSVSEIQYKDMMTDR